MEFRDLKAQYTAHRTELDAAIQDVLTGTRFIGGRQVTELEEALARYVGVKHCVACANGTDALQLALMAWEIGPGDAVFVPDFTFFSSGEVVPTVGAVPVFTDVEPDTYNISPQSLEEAIRYVIRHTDLKPRAVIAVDLFGQPADFAAIRAITDQYGLLLLEDGAQGFGGRIGARRACGFGDIATTSFFPAKPLGCYGDGGAVFTDHDEWADLIRSYRIHGKGQNKYDNIRIGMNSRLDTLQAAVLLEKLKFFDGEMEACGQIAAEYTRRLAERVKTPVIKSGMTSSWAQYTIQLSDEGTRDGLQSFLRERAIPTAVYYPKALHRQEAFAGCLLPEDDRPFAHTEQLCRTVLSLPFHPYMETGAIERVTDQIAEYLRLVG